MTASISSTAGIMALAIEVQLAVDAGSLPSPVELSTWALAAWQDKARDAEVVVRVTDEAESRQLNHEFRGKDKATNVLSFPFDPVPEIDLDHAGDLVICAPVVEREAGEQGKGLEAHWAHMVVHGMLHLQGYDHESDAEAAEMEALETDILSALGYPAPYADEHTPSGVTAEPDNRG
jgi:probable rRNA maturation factor